MNGMIYSASRPLRIGTRGSPLALAQAVEVRARLMAAHGLPEDAFEIAVISTSGDNRAMIEADRPLKEIGNKGLFTKEIEEAMLAGEIDIAVHSTKDMPVEQPEGLVIDCFLPRADARDAFVSREFGGLDDLPQGAIVGTSSLRRKAQLLHRRPDLSIVEFRGNVQTRLRKLGDGVAQATFLAMAGLARLGAGGVPASALPPEAMLPAVAQGVICVERRAEDAAAAAVISAIHDGPTSLQMAAERSFLAALDGSCETPIAGYAVIEAGEVWLRGEILRVDGSECLRGETRGPAENGASLGRDLARRLLERAGDGFFAP